MGEAGDANELERGHARGLEPLRTLRRARITRLRFAQKERSEKCHVLRDTTYENSAFLRTEFDRVVLVDGTADHGVVDDVLHPADGDAETEVASQDSAVGGKIGKLHGFDHEFA